MNLLIARSNFHSYSETFIDEQIKQLQPVEVLYEGWLPNQTYSGKSIYPFPLSHLAVRGSLRNLVPRLYRKIYQHYLKRFLRANQIDAFLANYGPLGSNIYEACLELGIPYSIVFLGFDANEKKTLDTYRADYAAMLPNAQAVIVVAASMRANLEAIAGPLTNLHVIPCGVDLSIFNPTDNKSDRFTFISVARFAEKKGPIYSLRAFEIVCQQFPKARLQMVGDGPMWEEAKAFVREKGLSENVEFLGAMSQAEYLPYLQAADVFVQHSIITKAGDSEGTPVAILEAAACGLPTVSTRHAGIPDAVIEGETGLLTDEHDVQGMAEACIFLAQNEGPRKKMGVSARKHIEMNYDVVKLSQKIKSVVKFVVL
ncbi:MAG: putative colanic acid biosynthesis glycosyltransferase WcaL [Bacteroidota bacterium]|jgi:glycosyltransferase involved in cell wall biosynthesis